ncbi:All-trans-phytoene synthase [Candidatus Xiphinematobacter sp. Idaho Grape]|nr:All-trans-phytoene synthase [Candidatus Xiphinematobacter sp. Idaho Grape]
MAFMIPGITSSAEKVSNLAFAFSLLRGQKSADIRTLYKFCRSVDDIADSPNLSTKEKSRMLESWADAFIACDYSPFPSELSDLIFRRALNPSLFLEIIHGVSSDLHPVSYQTLYELRRYCWRVASTVGLISIQIFECKDPQSYTYAEMLGLALQLTHILRDLGKDAQLGRVYIPEEDLQHFQITRQALLRREREPRFSELMRFESQCIRKLFDEVKMVFPQSDRKNLLPAETMRFAYETLLAIMEVDGFQSLTKHYTLSRAQKIWCATKAFICR